MEKTIDVLLQEKREQLINTIAEEFEFKSRQEIMSDLHSYNDCAVIAKMYLKAAHEVRQYK